MLATLLPEKQLRYVLDKTCSFKKKKGDMWFFGISSTNVLETPIDLLNYCMCEIDIFYLKMRLGFHWMSGPDQMKAFDILKQWFIPNSFKDYEDCGRMDLTKNIKKKNNRKGKK